MYGKCLCGLVMFEIAGEKPRLYQCHCSQCRKQSGAASNAAAIIPNKYFQWLSGHENVSSWVSDTGFRSDFCSKCGSPVPNPLRSAPYYWVPAGLFEGNEPLTISAQLCVGSKAAWDVILGPGKQYEEMPELAELLKMDAPPRKPDDKHH